MSKKYHGTSLVRLRWQPVIASVKHEVTQNSYFQFRPESEKCTYGHFLTRIASKGKMSLSLNDKIIYSEKKALHGNAVKYATWKTMSQLLFFVFFMHYIPTIILHLQFPQAHSVLWRIW